MEMAATAVPTMRVWLFDGGGAQVEFCCPLSISNMAQEAHNYLANLLAGGFSLTMPGMEKGEQMESIGFVLRQQKVEEDGRLVPILQLYSANEAMTWPVVKVYLNNEADIFNAEKAMGVVLTKLPLYDGTDKPERTPAAPKITKLPKSLDVIIKDNPAYNPDEPDPRKRKPKRTFVRFAALSANSPTTQPTPPADKPATTKASNKAASSEGWQATIVRVDVTEWNNKGTMQQCYDLYTADNIKIRHFGSHTDLVNVGVDGMSIMVVGASVVVDPFIVTYKEKVSNGYTNRQTVTFVGPPVPEMDVPF